ncbi:ABC transporter substrate-binding protein [Mechercharimyces sp. CAU 1602]|uniref:ABC transporter substrate-binding protein n=1 Tax=Mechercharimyces sp. CAU 1602 TaxID=2973933 RepID=UPI0021621481|nr:iron-siderophore ABC transporter substrate-binding protein [Mechercharimyces sp. CAU 1602]MCS1352838.1 iron-siderophore ABC transporter substrate-binding protein [Mechercharimyces sp. CAU 1602]
MKRRWNRFYTLLSLLLVLSLALTACTTNEADTGSKEKEKKSEAVRTVEHAMGKTEIKGTPERVVVLTNEGTDIVVSMGVKPVGAVQSWIGDPFFDYIKDDLKEVKVVGDELQPNLETIASLNPDLIIGTKVRHEKIYDKLSQIAPTVMSDYIGVTWKDNVALYGEALNKEEKATQLMDDWNKRVASFKEKLGEKADTKVSIVRFLPDHTRISYNMFPDAIIKEVGLSRPESQTGKEDPYAKVTKERIPEMDGDVMAVLSFAMEGQEKDLKSAQDEWMNDPLWKNLDVVKSGQVYEVNDVTWNTAGGYKAANLMLDDLEKYFTSK